MAPTLVILAAGVASRYGGPKQLEPMGPGGAAILDYAIHDARRTGFGNVVLVVRPEMEPAFRESIGARWQGNVPITFAHQRVPAGREKPWGTGDAVLAAKDHIRGEPFAVANADDFYGHRAFAALADFLGRIATTSTDYALVGYPLRETLSDAGGVNRGVCRTTADGWLESIEEILNIRPSGQDGVHEGFGLPLVIPGDTPVSMNLWGFTAALFPHLEKGFERFRRERGTDPKAEFLLPSLIQELVRTRRARVRVLPAGEHWCGVTYPADKPRVEAALRALVEAGEYPAEPWR